MARLWLSVFGSFAKTNRRSKRLEEKSLEKKSLEEKRDSLQRSAWRINGANFNCAFDLDGARYGVKCVTRADKR